MDISKRAVKNETSNNRETENLSLTYLLPRYRDIFSF